MRTALALLLLALAAPAAAQTPPAEAPPPPEPAPPAVVPTPQAPGNTRVYGGVALMTYSEKFQTIRFVADNQAGVIAGLETVWSLGRPDRQIAVAAQVAITNDVYMKATRDGMITQENRFHQEVIEIAARYRWRRVEIFDGAGVSASWWDLGYRGTMQRLHFTDIPGFGDANETVYANGVEVGHTWQRHTATRARSLRLGGGMNYALARNDVIDDDDFGAMGLAFSLRGQVAWRLGGSWFALGALVDYRRQNGSDIEDVSIMGMQGQAVWPKNETWIVLGSVGVLFGLGG